MSLTPQLIEEKTKLIEEYMFEIEKQLRTGLEIINELKKDGKPETEEFQNQIIDIIKKIEFCAASVEKELEAEGSPTYYLANGRINIANEMPPAFSITQVDDDDDDDDDDVSDDDSDVSFTEEERQHIENEEHYSYLKRYGLKPSAQFSFTISQNGDDVSGNESLVDSLRMALEMESLKNESLKKESLENESLETEP